MELDENDRAELMRFETVQTKKEGAAAEGGDIEFDKIKISDVSRVLVG